MSSDSFAAVRARATAAGGTDVAAIAFAVSCEHMDGTPSVTLERVVALEGHALPGWIEPGLGAAHAFADLFFVAPSGQCLVTAAALDAAGLPSADCGQAQLHTVVAQGETTESALLIPCAGASAGAIDVVGTLNYAPILVAVVYEPDHQISVCAESTVVVDVRDPEGKPVQVDWAVASAPDGADYAVTFDGLTASLVAATPGVYVLRLVLSDPDGGIAEWEVPFFVSVNPEIDAADCDPQTGCFPGKCDDGIPCTLDTCVDGVCYHEMPDEVCDGVDNNCNGVIDEGCVCPRDGDVNGNGVTNVADAQCTILVSMWILGGEVGSPPACLGGADPSVADLNCDGVVNVADVQIVIMFALGVPLPLVLDSTGNGCVDACQPDPCGNGVCEPQESCDTCPEDCGACWPGG